MTESGDISVQSLMDEAAARAESNDWGDLGFTHPLGLLLDSCRDTASLTPSGWQVLRSTVLRHLGNRLALQGPVSRRPDPPAPANSQPIVITGLPRTGTTLLHNLLSQDGEHRVLRLWEALRPAQSRGDDQSERSAMVAAQAWLERFYALVPSFKSIHPATADGPEECDALLQNSFASQHFDDMFDARAYSHWFATSSLLDAYRYYAFQLEVLSAFDEQPKPWVLKSPGHLGHLDGLLHVFPHALAVHCHRHPAQAVASYASLIRAVRSPHTDRLDPAVVGRQALERSMLAMERALDLRDATPGGRFIDVAYGQLVRQPLEVVAGIYEKLGRPLPPEGRTRMRGWLRDHPQGGHGPHRYGLDEFGLSAGEVVESFRFYMSRFGSLVQP